MHAISPATLKAVTTTLGPSRIIGVVGGVFARRLAEMHEIEPIVQAVIWIYEWLNQFDILDQAGIERALVRCRPELEAWLPEFIAEQPTQFLLVVSDWRWYTWRNRNVFYDAMTNSDVAELPGPAKTMVTINVPAVIAAKLDWIQRLRIGDVVHRSHEAGSSPAGQPYRPHAYPRAPGPPPDPSDRG